MSTRKELFINSIKLVEIDDHTHIPTTVVYDSDKAFIGYSAFSKESEEYLLENFKLELGNQDPSVSGKKRFQTAKLQSKTAHEITKDFLEASLKKADEWIEARGYKGAARILVAEPIAMGEKESVKSSWLSNYRTHIKRILDHKFDNIDFLPEPFAVFQYYRYGIKHHLVAQKQKHVALVLDFGGGTFDVSVIETTATGDVSASGRNSRPLAASSRPIGGFYIDKMIAESLLFKAIPKGVNNSDYHQALKKFNEIETNERASIDTYRDDYKNFYYHFKALLRRVEKAKVLICNQIHNWDMEAQYQASTLSFPVKVPANALKEKTEYLSIKLDASELREIFYKKVWSKELKPAISNALTRAETELKGQPISIVLLSGGSSNIRWLASLLRSDLNNKLHNAEVLELQENFQEIVAKGLAVECARRTYNEGNGDFQSVTYNRLNLTLDPDEKGVEIKKFKPQTQGLPNVIEEDGVLLPSSSVLGNLIDQPIRWKVRLAHPPKRKLDYYFMRSSFDHEDTDNIFNLIDHTVHTKAGTKFESNIQIELTVKEDGTAYPKFIYQDRDIHDPSHIVEGKPFYMDMTFGSASGVSEAYLGFDFGSSNSSISYIERSAISVYQDRSKNSGWLELNNLVEVLPYPVAAPLAKYIAGSSSTYKDMLALEAIEAFLAFAAFFSYQEYCSIKGEKNQSRLFKGFNQRSAGPLWALLRETQRTLGKRAKLSAELNRLLDGQNYELINNAVTKLAEFKHGKQSEQIDYFNILTLLGNITNQVMDNKVFGSFENVRKQSFGKQGFTGQFRLAQGKNPPFIHVYNYTGQEPFSEEQVYIIDTSTSNALSLSPLYFWAQTVNSPRAEALMLYVYDIDKDNNFSYKATESSTPLLLTHDNEYAVFHEFLTSIKKQDTEVPIIKEVTIFNEEER